MATDLKDVVKYYTDRMANIYRSKPKASAQVALFVKQMLADNLASELNPAYDIDQAVGAQLDVIGKYVGADRDVQVPDTRPYFGFVTADYPVGDQNQHGFILAASVFINMDAIWYRCAFVDQSTSQLSDYAYAQLIKLKISTNFSDDTMGSVQEQIAGFFPGQLQLRDNLDMSMTYFFGSKFDLPTSVLKNYLPRPMGVNIDVKPAIGFDVFVDGQPSYNSQSASPVVTMASTAATFEIINRTSTSFDVIAVVASDPHINVSGFTPSLPVTLNNGDTESFVVSVSGTVQPSSLIDIYVHSAVGYARYEAKLIPPNNPPSPELRFVLDTTSYASGDSIQIQIPSASTAYIAALLDNLNHSRPTTVSGITCTWPGAHIGKDVSMTPLVYPFPVPGDPITNPPVVFKLDSLTGDDSFDIHIFNDSTTPDFVLHVRIVAFTVRANYETSRVRPALVATAYQDVHVPAAPVKEPISVRPALASTIYLNTQVLRTMSPEVVSIATALSSTQYVSALVQRSVPAEVAGVSPKLVSTVNLMALVTATPVVETTAVKSKLVSTVYAT